MNLFTSSSDQLLLDVCSNDTNWEGHSVGMIGRLSSLAANNGLPMPRYYVASWGNESHNWANQISAHGEFIGLYWNGGEERPEVPPPAGPYHGLSWELWIPYSAGNWGIGGVAEAVANSGFPREKIALQPNVYQPVNNRGFWDMAKCLYHARRHGIKLEIEFDENMHPTFKHYRWVNRISPKIFTCVYGGYKKILDIEQII